MSYCDESTVHSNLHDILQVAYTQHYSTMQCHCNVTAMTFQNILCQNNDIPEQNMSPRWHSRTDYGRVMTSLHTILLVCWCAPLTNNSLYSVFNCIDKAPGDSALLWGWRGSWVREALKSTASCNITVDSFGLGSILLTESCSPDLRVTSLLINEGHDCWVMGGRWLVIYTMEYLLANKASENVA